jgi:cytidine deaminase
MNREVGGIHPLEIKIENEALVKDMPKHLEYVEENLQKYVELAAKARTKAESHRGFFVGCALDVVRGKNGVYIHDAYAAANNTPVKKEPPATGPDKKCAERIATDAALDEDARLITAIVTISKESNHSREAGHSQEHDVLHPCLDCRQMMRGLMALGILRPESMLYNVNDSDPKSPKTFKKTVAEVLSIYKDDPPLEGSI